MNKLKLLSVSLAFALSGNSFAQSTPIQNYGDEIRSQYWIGTGNSATSADPTVNPYNLYFFGATNALNITNPLTQNVSDVSIVGSYNTSDTGNVKIFGDSNTLRSDWVYSNFPSSLSTGSIHVLGDNNNLNGQSLNVIGNANQVTGYFTNSLGSSNTLGSNVLNFGDANTVADGGISIGYANKVNYVGAGGTRSGISIGNYNVVDAACVVIGFYGACNEDRTVSFGQTGNSGNTARLTGVADGRANDDASTVYQLQSLARSLGGTAGYTNGVYNKWSVPLKDVVYTNVYSALRAIDGRLIVLETATPVDPVTPVEPTPQPSGNTVVAGRNIEVQDNQDGTTSVMLSDNVELSAQGRLSIQDGPSMDANGINAAGRKVTGVAAGSVSATSTDAVNGSQLYQVQEDFNDRWETTNRRMDRYDDKLNGLGAQMAAMSMMALAGGGNDSVGTVRFTMGVGAYGNQAAGAMGWRLRASDRVVWSGGLTFGSGGAKVGGGVGVSFDLGN